MIPFGTLFNVAAVILGSILGLLFKQIINEELTKKVFFVIGLFTLVLGFSMVGDNVDFILVFLSIVIGTILGEHFDLHNTLTNLIEKFKNKIKVKDDKFADGLVTAFLLFCVGSMTIVGAIDEGLGNPPHILYTKAIMDGISSIILASTLGLGVLFSIFPMLLFQSSITLLVYTYNNFIPTILIEQITCVGGVLIIAIGIKILGYKNINPTNMLPTLLVIVLLYFLKVEVGC